MTGERGGEAGAKRGSAGDDVLTLQETADLLGVHYMTAYRYIRLGLLPATKEGTSWRVRRADIDLVGDPAAGSMGSGRRLKAPWRERLERRLRAGDETGTWGVIEAALTSGSEPAEIYLDLLAPAMVAVGEAWEAGEIDVWEEHRASAIVLRMLGRLSPRFVRRGRTRGSVLVGGAPGEQHGLPMALLTDLLRGAGYGATDLGPNLPVESFERAASQTPRLLAVGVSATTDGNDRAVARVIEVVRGVIGERVVVLAGGRAVLDEEHARSLGADAWAPDARATIAYLDECTRAPST